MEPLHLIILGIVLALDVFVIYKLRGTVYKNIYKAWPVEPKPGPMWKTAVRSAIYYPQENPAPDDAAFTAKLAGAKRILLLVPVAMLMGWVMMAVIFFLI